MTALSVIVETSWKAASLAMREGVRQQGHTRASAARSMFPSAAGGGGGVVVHSGDLIVADEDGVCVVPLARVDATLEAYSALKEREAKTIKSINEGGTLADIYGIPDVVTAREE